MRILFITACLEPGRDGVGDYTRTLARACSNLGHSCALLSLNEPGPVPRATWSAYRSSTELRLRGRKSWKTRTTQARQFIEFQRPDWISLQFVSYGWNSRGICAGLSQRLQRIISGHNFHIMFHELWIGHYPHAPIKERLIGSAQRFCILRLVQKLKPQVVHTNTSAYVKLLEDANVHAEKLPLFGNIPIAPEPTDEWLLQEINYAGVEITRATRDRFWLVGMFGTIHPNWPPEPLLSRLRDAARQQGKNVILLSIGRIGPGRELWNKISGTHGEGITFLELGERSPEFISWFLQSIDFGVAGSPYSLIEKSGSAAAMLEHGCPLVANWIDPGEQPHDYDALILPLDSALDFAALRRRAPLSRLPVIAERLVARLSEIPEATRTHEHASKHIVRPLSQ